MKVLVLRHYDIVLGIMCISFFRCVINYLTSGPVIALELLGKHGITRWKELAGSNDSKQACSTKPSLRACYGKDELSDAAYGSENVERATRVSSFFLF